MATEAAAEAVAAPEVVIIVAKADTYQETVRRQGNRAAAAVEAVAAAGLATAAATTDTCREIALTHLEDKVAVVVAAVAAVTVSATTAISQATCRAIVLYPRRIVA